MEINCGLVKLTVGERSRVMCAGGEAALAALLVSAQLASLTQECMKLLVKLPKLGGDNHTSCPSEPLDAENDGGDEDEDDDEGEGEEEQGEDKDDGKSAAKSSLNGVGENGDMEDVEEGEAPNEEDDEDNDGEDDEEEDADAGEDNDEEDDDDDEEDEEEEEEEDKEEEALQPPKKRKK